MKIRFTLLLSVCLFLFHASAQPLLIPSNAHRWCYQSGLEQTVFALTFANSPTVGLSTFTSGDNGAALLQVPAGTPDTAIFRITPYRDSNPLEGLSTFDLAETLERIEGHLDGTEPFTLVEQWFGADVDMDGAITQNDPDLLQDLLSGIYNELPVSGWRFVPKSFAFENPAMPLFPIPPGFIEGTVAELNLNQGFWAFQIGRIPESSPCETTGTTDIFTFSAYDASPNPTEGGFEIEVEAPRPMELRGEVFDITGKCVWKQTYQQYPAGISTFIFDVDLMPGTYVWKISDRKEHFQIGRIVRE